MQYRDTINYADDMAHVASLSRADVGGGIELTVDDRSTVTGTAGAGRINSPNVWWLASHETPSDGRFANHYGEVLIYDRRLSRAEVGMVHGYLRARRRI